MSPRLVTRAEVARKLSDWADGHISAEDILNWADALYPCDDVEYEDWERDEDSVTNEVLAALSMLDMDLVLPEDIPIYLAFLSTPAGQFESGYAKFRQKLGEIDYASRRKHLRDVPPYSRFVGP